MRASPKRDSLCGLVRRAFSACGLWLIACASPSPAPTLVQLEPARTVSSQATPLVLVGTHFAPAVTLDFDRPSQSVVASTFRVSLSGPESRALNEVTWVDATHLTAVTPVGLAVGTYAVSVEDPLQRTATLDAALTVVAPESVDAGPDAGPTCTTVTWADLDHDGYGDPATRANVCDDPSRVEQGDDCNDVDPQVHPGVTERCNQLDDNCNGQVDEGACSGGATWGQRSGAGLMDWQSAWSWTPGGLWLVGSDQAWVLNPGGFFTNESTGCPMSLRAAWAWPGLDGGEAWVGGGPGSVGRVAWHSNASNRCEPWLQFGDPVVGLVGFAQADGGVEVRGALRNGRLLLWPQPGDGSEVDRSAPSNTQLADLHGVDVDTLYAVGTNTDENRMVVLRLAGTRWVSETLPGVRTGALRGVWVLSPDSVFVVGDNGTVAERRDGGWVRLPSPGGTLQAVRAFNRGRVYVVSREGVISRWNGSVWQSLFDGGSSYRDLTATSDEDVWAVGLGGAVTHWPEPP
jgi:Putative metal-binding motif